VLTFKGQVVSIDVDRSVVDKEGRGLILPDAMVKGFIDCNQKIDYTIAVKPNGIFFLICTILLTWGHP